MEISVFCESFYSSHYIPVVLLQDKKVIGSFCGYSKFEELFQNFENRFLNLDTFPAVVNSSNLGLYGVICEHQTDTLIVLGPVYNKKPNKDDVLRFINKSFADVADEESIYEFISSIPCYNYNSFLNLLTFMEYCINGNQISVTDVFFDEKVQENVAKIQADVDWRDENIEHGTYFLEQEIIDYVSQGDVVGLKQFLTESLKTRNFNEGKLADNELRQAKNILLGMLVMVGKVGAIKGGLSVEESYSLIDIYNQECEKCRTIEEVKNLQYNSLIDFTTKVAKNKKLLSYSNETNMAIEYIKNHITSNIQVMDVVCYVGISRASLLAKFKKETSQTMGSFIMKCKLEKSKMLLKYSQRSLSEISSYLGFSSQSYFQNTFKKEYGVTPLTFKKESQ